MKKIFLFVLVVFSLNAKMIFNSQIQSGINDVIQLQNRELDSHLEKVILKEIKIYIDKKETNIEEVNNYLNQLENSLRANPRIRIISESEIKNSRNTYTLTLAFKEPRYKIHMGLKHEFSAISALELISNDSNGLSFSSYKPLSFIWRLSDLSVIAISFGIFLIGIILWFLTKKKYDKQIAIVAIILAITFNFYFYVIL